MISKNLCFKLMKEDGKRRIWTISLLFLTFFFSIVLPIIFAVSEPANTFPSQQRWINYVTQSVITSIGPQNLFVVAIMVIGSVICAVSGFSYLYTNKKVDLYHCIPVKRGQLFTALFLNGILMTGVIYLLNVLIGMVIASIFGVSFSATASIALMTFGFHMAYYILLYATVVLAMTLTGNMIIALLGTLVFFFYGPGVTALVNSYMSIWFSYYSRYSDIGGSSFFETIIKNSSPLVHYINNVANYHNVQLAETIVTVLFIAVLLFVLTYWLYRCRPSEASGKAMSFSYTMMPIKMLLVIPSSLAFSLFFWEMRESNGWTIFGLLFGAVFTHCLIEIIYHFDFKKLFTHKKHLAICIIASLIIFSGFQFDWFGYDAYLPKESDVKAAAISIDSEGNWVSYGKVRSTIINYDTLEYYWEYEDGIDYVKNNMEITDVKDILSLAQKGIDASSESVSPDYTVYIQYTLMNGRNVSRRYVVPMDVIEDEVERITDSMEYKVGYFPILKQTAEETVNVNIRQLNVITAVNQERAAKKLLEAYKQDFMELSVSTRKQELPIASIQFMTVDQREAVNFEPVYDYYEDYYIASNIADRSYYPIYPSFTRTLEGLQEFGISIQGQIKADRIAQISISSKKMGEKDSIMYYTDPKDIERLAPALVFGEYWKMNGGMIEGVRRDIELTVFMYSNNDMNEGDTKRILAYLDESKLPAPLN